MGQFKPMVKMMTTEPTVELKLKKGGHVNMKKGGKAEEGHKKMANGGGAMAALAGTPALIGRPAVNAPVRAPGKPSMASRRKAMMAKKPMTPSGPAMPPPKMKKGGSACGSEMAKGGESKGMKKVEMSKIKGLAKDMKSHASKPASKAHKGLKSGGMACATGGVALGNAGGYKAGGMAEGGKMPMKDGKPAFLAKKMKSGGKACAKGGVMGDGVLPESMSAKGAESYKNTMMKTAQNTGKSSGKTGGVRNGNAGGYATGGVALGNAGGYKMGGKATKKAYAAGGTVNSGRPVAMPQGSKPAPPSVKINQLAGTYKNGGRATPAEARLLKNNAAENKTAMRQAKTDSNMKYMKGGGATSDKDMSKGAYDAHYAREKAENEADSKMMKDAMMFLPRQAKKAFNSLTGRGAMSDKEASMPSTSKGMGSVTETEKSITVAPGKKRGGRAC